MRKQDFRAKKETGSPRRDASVFVQRMLKFEVLWCRQIRTMYYCKVYAQCTMYSLFYDWFYSRYHPLVMSSFIIHVFRLDISSILEY